MPLPPLLGDLALRSAAPGVVLPWLERLYSEQPEQMARIGGGRGRAEPIPGRSSDGTTRGELVGPGELAGLGELAGRLVTVAAASRSLSRLILAEPEAIDVVASPERRRRVAEASTPADLARLKQLELLRIAVLDLTGAARVDEVAEMLADLADDVLAAAWRLAGAGGIAVIGMGKHGARELNYASDVDILFVGSGDAADNAAARRLLEIARGAFRIDTDLRPEGRDGPLVRSLDSYLAYWDRWARPWEFQSLLKARAVAGAGPPELSSAFEAEAALRVWSGRLDADALAELRSMKARAEAEVERRGLSRREIKRGPGGIRDIEFAVQLLQLVHGPTDPALRIRATLPALGELASAGYVATEDASALALAYRFLRTVEHRLQLVEEAQVHTVPADGEARDRLARVLGWGDGEETALERFGEVLSRHQASVRTIHERLFFRPLLEAYRGSPGSLAEGEVLERLAAFGFRDPERTRQAVDELTRGLTRSSRLMQQLLPLLLDWCSASPDPDLALLGLRTLSGGGHRRDVLLAVFRESPEAARRVCLLGGTSRDLLELMRRQPEIVAALADRNGLDRPTREELVARALAQGRRADALGRLVRSELARTAIRDVLGLDGAAETARSLTDVSESVVVAALEAVEPRVPFAVVAMGRLGGGELAYGSDLDLLLVYDGNGAADAADAERAAASLLRLLRGPTPAERILAADVSLRPEGRHGALARSLGAYEEYERTRMQTWERQALLRARPVAGDPEVARRFMEFVDRAVWGRPADAAAVRDVRRMKARVERERLPPGADPQFHLKLGRGSLSDVEWTVQLMQMQSGVRSPATMEALSLLEAGDHLSAADAGVLREAYRYCERARNRWHLVGNFLAVGGAPGAAAAGADSLPHRPEQLSRLARSLGTSPAELREDYRRVTRRARAVVERLFYGL